MIVITGSAANPPHVAHAAFVRSLIHDGRVSQVWWKVDLDRPDKEMEVPFKHRLRMTELLFEELLTPDENCSITINPQIITPFVPTIEQIEAASAEFPDETFAWAVGADQLQQVDGQTYVERYWMRGSELIHTYPYFVTLRGGYEMPDTETLPGAPHVLSSCLPMVVSSTELRDQLRCGRKDIPHLPDPVLSYINHHHLYQE